MSPVWFWRPSWHWFGWKTLIPFTYGHDQFARRVLVFGWTVTGRILIAVWGCGSPECESEGARNLYIAQRALNAKRAAE